MNFDLSRLKSIDINQLLAQSRKIDLRTILQANKLLFIGGFSVVLVIVYVFAIFIPNFDGFSEKRSVVNSIPDLEQNITVLAVNAARSKQSLDAAKQEYDSLNELFSVDSELEEVYRELGKMAGAYSLVIVSLNKEFDEPVYPNSPAQDGQPAAGQPQNQNPNIQPLFYRIKLKAELLGHFSKYLQFREAISGYSKRINFEKEQISVVEGNTKGMVQVRLQISTFRLPNKLTTAQLTNTSLISAKTTSLIALIDRLFGISFANAQEVNIQPTPSVNAKSLVPSSMDRPAVSTSGGRDSTNKYNRDPFSKSTSGMIDTVRDPRVSPLLVTNIENYHVIGIIVGKKKQTAIIKTDLKESFIVKVGDRLGNKGGVISKISSDSVYVRQGRNVVRLYLQSPTGSGSSDAVQ